MTRRDWWIGVTLLCAVVLIHAAIPRYEWRHVQGVAFTKVDRWTGTMRFGAVVDGRWVERNVADLR